VYQSRDVILEAFLAIRLQELEDEKGIVAPIKGRLEALAEENLLKRE
jgi:hypothetical protein